MRLGAVVRNSGGDAVRAVRELPQHAEELGFDSVWFTDHVIGARAFEPVYEPEWVEALTALSYLASATRRIRIGVSVMVAPYRDPVYAAKVLSSIDNLSDGRLVVGIGAGWSRTEYRALGKAELYPDRGKVTDEVLALMRRCWQGGEMGWSGEHFEFTHMIFGPTPVQRSGPPLLIGGQSRPAIRRAASFGDAWHPTGQNAAQVVALGGELDQLAGRSIPRVPRISVDHAEPGDLESQLDSYQAAGCAGLVVASTARTVEDQLRFMDLLADAARGRGLLTDEADGLRHCDHRDDRQRNEIGS